MKLLIFLILSLGISIPMSCQNHKDGETPEAVKATFQSMYPGEDDPDWHLDSNDNYESHFKIDGIKYRADYAPNGEWIETETNISSDELPEAIQAVINDRYFLYTIAEIEKVEHHSKGTFYDVEFKQKGKNYDVEFRADGSIISK